MRQSHFTLTGIALLSLAAVPFSAEAASSVYTDLNLDKCETVEHFEDGVSLRCTGFEDYPIHFKEGDLRQSVLFGAADELLIKESFESFGPFNHVNTKVEWRLGDDGKPFATILRWFIENSNPDTGEYDEAYKGQVLVISRVARPGDAHACVVGYVDALANANANDLAREVADTAAVSFACGYNEPMWHGERGEKSGEPMRYIPDEFKVE